MLTGDLRGYDAFFFMEMDAVPIKVQKFQGNCQTHNKSVAVVVVGKLQNQERCGHYMKPLKPQCGARLATASRLALAKYTGSMCYHRMPLKNT